MAASLKGIRGWIMTSAIIAGCTGISTLFAAPVPVVSYVQQANGVLFTMATGQMLVKPCTGSIIRVVYTPKAAFSTRVSLMAVDTFPTPPAWTMDTSATAVTVQVANLQAVVTKATGAVAFLGPTGTPLISENPDTGKICARATVDTSGYGVDLAFNITTAENIYGLGYFDDIDSNYFATAGKTIYGHTYYSTLNRNLNGYVARMMVANMCKPIPFLMSTNQYGLLWDNYSDSYFSFLGATARTMSVRSTVADQVDYYVIYGAVFDSIVAGYRTITGSSPMLPKYAYGFWHSRNAGPTTSEAGFLDTFTKFRTNTPTIPIDVCVQDWFTWNSTTTADGNWNSLIWDPTRYPTPATMIDSLHDMHMHYAVSVWPTLGAVTGIYADFKSRGWTWPLLYSYGNGFPYDAYNPHADSLLWVYMNTGSSTVPATNGYFNKGVDIWWFDGSEPETGDNAGMTQPLLYAAITGQDSSGKHRNYLGSFYRYCGNGFSLQHSLGVYSNMRAATASTTNQRVCVLTRSVYAGQQRTGAISWGGDETGTWGQYASDGLWGMEFCAAGNPYWTSDIGAFYTSASTGNGTATNATFRPFFTRWFQAETFYPVLRVHGDANNGSDRREMWAFQPYDATDSCFSAQYRFDRLRYRLMPYIYSLAWMVHSQSYTIMRTLAFDFPNDPTVLAANAETGTEWMFGPDILACPFTAAGTGTPMTNTRTVYLPGSGTTWWNFWSDSQFTGGVTKPVTMTITGMPLYIRAGSILPLGPNIQYALQKQPDTIALRIYRGANGSFTLYEDDGTTYAYENGTYATIPLSYSDASPTLTIGARSGSFPGMLATRTFKIVWERIGHGTGLDSSVAIAPTDSDRYVTYTGSAITIPIVGAVGVLHGTARIIAPALSRTFTTAGSTIVFPQEFSGRTKAVDIYNLKGTLLKRVVTTAGQIDIRKDFGAAAGVYIVKLRTMP